MKDPVQKIIIGYSGGADSTCLLHWSLSQDCQVVAAHLHHGIRREADDDVKHCRDFCEKLEIELETEIVEVPLLSKEKKISIEEAAREARYSFLEQVRQRHNAEWIFVGHTQDDHLETMLFQMIRGSGMRGLRGLPQQNKKVVRPLWNWTRVQTESYCKQHNLLYLNDSMNQDLQYSRVKIRKTVLPSLLEVHPGSRNALLRLSRIAEEENTYLDEIAYSAIIKAEKKQRLAGERRFRRKDLLELHPVLLKRGIMYVAREWNIGLNFLLMEKIVQGLCKGTNGGINTEQDRLCIFWDSEQLKFRKNK